MVDYTKYCVCQKVKDEREYMILARFAFYDDAKNYYLDLCKFSGDIEIDNFFIEEDKNR